MSLASEVLDLAKNKSLMVATAESCTGGMVAASLTEVPGSSTVVDRGFITYSNSAKSEMLGVRAETLETYGAVSQEVAREMALGAQAHSEAHLTVSVTGIAGPGGSDHKPEGRVCFGLCFDEKVQTETIEFGAIGRSAVRNAACDHALNMLKNALNVAT